MRENRPSGSMSGTWKRSICHRATSRLYRFAISSRTCGPGLVKHNCGSFWPNRRRLPPYPHSWPGMWRGQEPGRKQEWVGLYDTDLSATAWYIGHQGQLAATLTTILRVLCTTMAATLITLVCQVQG